MIIIGTICLAFGIGTRLQAHDDTPYNCPEDAVWTWNGDHGFPAPDSDYGCIALDNLMSD